VRPEGGSERREGCVAVGYLGVERDGGGGRPSLMRTWVEFFQLEKTVNFCVAVIPAEDEIQSIRKSFDGE